MIFTRDEVWDEVMRRLTTEALVFLVALGEKTTWGEFEEKWYAKYPGQSYFISGYVAPLQ